MFLQSHKYFIDPFKMNPDNTLFRIGLGKKK